MRPETERRFNLSRWALAHRPLVLFLILATALAGLYTFDRIGRSEDPPFAWKTMIIRTEWPGASARDVERFVTDVIQKKLQEVPYYDFDRAYSRPGLSVIQIVVKEWTPPAEIPDIWYQVRKKVGDIEDTLPLGTKGPFFDDEFGEVYSFMYGFSGPAFSPAELKTIAEDARETLLDVAQVEKVELIGVQEEKIFVEMASRRLASFGLTGEQVIQTIRNANVVVPSGKIDLRSDRLRLRVSSGFDALDAIRSLPIDSGGRQITIGDVTTVRRGYVDPPVSTMRVNGQDAVGIGVVMTPGGHVLRLGERLAGAVEEIRDGLPAGVVMTEVANQAQVVDQSTREFLKAFVEALVIVMLVSFVSLGWRSGLVVALAVPLVLALTVVLMVVLDIDLHRISLGALIMALGLLVDDAIISAEAMQVKIEEGWDRVEAGAFAYASTAFPMLTGTLITAAGFIPIGFAASSSGEYTQAIFWVVTLALVLSWIVAVLFTPYLGFHLMRPPRPGAVRRASYDGPVYRRLRALIAACVRWRWLTILVTVLALGASVHGFRFVPKQFFPDSDRPELVIDLRLAESASFAATAAEVARMEAMLDGDERVERHVAYTGAGAPRFFLTFRRELENPNFAQFVVHARSPAARDALAADIMRVADEAFPAARIRIGRLEVGPPVGYPVQFRVIGSDPERLREIAHEIRDTMHTHENLANISLDWGEKAKRVRLEVDPFKARALGITNDFLSMTMQVLLDGLAVTQFRGDNELVDVVVRTTADERLELGQWEDLNVPLPPSLIRTEAGWAPLSEVGGWVPLSQLATVHYDFEEPILWRRSRESVMTVRADVVGDVQAPMVSRDVEARLTDLRTRLPAGYRIEVGGAAEASSEGNSSIAATLPIMVLVTLGLLMVQLQSFRRMVLVLVTAPFGFVGIVGILLATGQPFGFVAMLGSLAMTGIIMRNAVILIDQIARDERAGAAPMEAVVEATVRRSRPIALTALASILGLLPLTASTFWGPMAVAIMGGLAAATLLTLLFVPAFYAALYRVRAKPAPDPMAGLGRTLA